MKKYDVVIIGAGTAGLTARREVAKKTDNYLIIEGGPLGTTCARVGCMPSKVLIQAANDIHQFKKISSLELVSTKEFKVSQENIMSHVRSLRDRFVRGVLSSVNEWEDKLLRGRAQFLDKNTVQVGEQKIVADKFIIATGSRPIMPGAWEPYKDLLIDTNNFFELETLPKKVAVIGLGVIGLELGQALSRLGVEVIGINKGAAMGGLSDPKLQDYVLEKFKKEFPIYTNGAEILGKSSDSKLQIKVDDQVIEVDKAILSMGRRPNTDKIGLENIGVKLDPRGMPQVDNNNLKLVDAPHIYFPGDVNAFRPILHEAADEGKIAGHNAVNENACFKRRVSLGITFSDPNIATVGKRFSELKDSKHEFVAGEVSFEGQGRSIVKLKEQGLLRVYADKSSGHILGAEMQAPSGEHLAHLLAWSISLNLTVFEALKMPFYHPVIEEGLRTALRNAATKIEASEKHELFRCEDPPIR